jgi:hypothetical protein
MQYTCSASSWAGEGPRAGGGAVTRELSFVLTHGCALAQWLHWGLSKAQYRDRVSVCVGGWGWGVQDIPHAVRLLSLYLGR